ncbi:MAG: gluconate 2-dehydrogenase subunit 3 family protein [Thaumarchaeota archaeon]|nr:gluconate 2-dehydrogenase subunit 3 family protein [Nitrososphaerota archaeon]
MKVGAAAIGGLVVGAAAVYVAKPSTTSTETSTVTSTLPGSTVTSVSTVTSTLPASTVTETSTGSVTCTTASSSAQAQIAALQAQIDTMTGFVTLSTTEQSLLAAIAETMIPDDGNGPDAAAAGVIYFIDRQLAGDYGKSAHMYMEGPFIPPNQTGPITLDGITYSGGSTLVSIESGMQYQYHNNFREFFRYGLDAFETYCNSAYGGNFETLSAANQLAALTDLYNNKPTSFNEITPSDFFYEVFVMVWSGYFMDPIYGGNKGMAAWVFSAFNGVNQGNFYGEGHTTKELMVATTPTQLMPASLAQYQKGSP